MTRTIYWDISYSSKNQRICKIIISNPTRHNVLNLQACSGEIALQTLTLLSKTRKVVVVQMSYNGRAVPENCMHSTGLTLDTVVDSVDVPYFACP